MERRTAIFVVGMVLIAGGGVFRVIGGGGANNANYPDGTDWRCLNPECGQVFHKTIKQLAEHHEAHWGEPVPCPHCGQSKTRSTEKD